jgi:membrane-bound lytic murein transglycosylase D
MFSGIVWAQTETATNEEGNAGASPFTAIHDSLMQRADLILSSKESVVLVSAPQVQDAATAESPSQENRTSRRESLNGYSSALARLDLLRPTIIPILERENVPAEMAAIILRESGGSVAALSAKGARGLWQLMPDTARRYGLTVDETLDERLDVEKSTVAAARYLKDLMTQFRSWPLVLAAYNVGEHGLQRAIDRSHSEDFEVLSSLKALPAETRAYVPAVISDIRTVGSLTVFSSYQRPVKATVIFAPSTQ